MTYDPTNPYSGDPNSSYGSQSGAGGNPYGYEPQSFGQGPGEFDSHNAYGGAYGQSGVPPRGSGQPPYGQPGYGANPYGQNSFGDPMFGASGYGQQPFQGQPQYPYDSQPFNSMPGPAPDGRPFKVPGLDVGRVISDAWDGFTDNIGGWILWCLAYFVAIFVSMFAIIVAGIALYASITTVGRDFDPNNDDLPTIFSSGAGASFLFWMGSVYLLIILIYFLFTHMAFVSSLRIANGERLDVGDFFKFRNFGTYFATSFLSTLALAAVLLIPVLGYILVIPLMYFFYFVLYAAVDGHSVTRCFSVSWHITTKNAGLCLLCGIIFGVLSAIGGFVLVGYLITLPMTLVGSAVVYRSATRGYQPIPKKVPFVPGY